jgi:hypothetical protein
MLIFPFLICGDGVFRRRARLLFATREDGLWFDGLVTSAALGIEEAEKLLQSFGVGGVPEERAFPSHLNEFLVF